MHLVKHIKLQQRLQCISRMKLKKSANHFMCDILVVISVMVINNKEQHFLNFFLARSVTRDLIFFLFFSKILTVKHAKTI